MRRWVGVWLHHYVFGKIKSACSTLLDESDFLKLYFYLFTLSNISVETVEVIEKTNF